VLPVSLEEARRHCRVDFTDDDLSIQTYLEAAIATIEGPHGIGVALSPQTWRLSMDYFPCQIVIPLGPVSEISSITYVDDAGAAAEVDEWRTDLDTEPVRIWPARDKTWPAITCEPGAVKVEFITGYESTPADLRAAVLLLTAHLYENREAVTEKAMTELPMAVDSILNRYRVGRVA